MDLFIFCEEKGEPFSFSLPFTEVTNVNLPGKENTMKKISSVQEEITNKI